MSVDSPAARPPRRPGRPKGSKGDDTRRMIIDAAQECFGELGFERTTLALVAERSHLTRSAVYNYFDSKEALAEAVMLESSGELYKTLLGALWWRTEIPSGLSVIEKLHFLMEQCVEVAETTNADPDFYLRVVRSSEAGDEVRKVLVSFVKDQRSVLSGLLVEGIASGEFSTDLDFETTLDALQGIIWAIAIGMMTAPNGTTRRQVRLGVQLVLRAHLITESSTRNDPPRP